MEKISLLAIRLLFAINFVYIFIASSLIASFVCLFLILFLWPCAKTTYRRVVCWIIYTVLAEMIWVCRDWASLDIVMYAEASACDLLGKESQLFVCSHRGDLDWIAVMIVGTYHNFLRSMRTLPKRSVLFVPGFGQILWAVECPFLSRNYSKDRALIARYAGIYNNYPYPVQVFIFCEGTRYTEEKHRLAVKYEQERGLPILKHHLAPRTKGFAVLAEHFKPGGFAAVVDIGFAYRNWPGKNLPSFLDILLGKKVELLWYMRRFPMADLPDDHEGLQRFCYQLFEDKDKAYEHFVQHNSFPGPIQPLPPFDQTLWGLRLATLFWTIITYILPAVLLFCYLSWTSLGLFCVVTTLFNGAVLAGLLKYAHGGSIPTNLTGSEKKTD